MAGHDVLVRTDDVRLLDLLLPALGAAGVEPLVLPPGLAAADGAVAPRVVIVGIDAARLADRPGSGVVVLAALAEQATPAWRAAEDAGIDEVTLLPAGAARLVEIAAGRRGQPVAAALDGLGSAPLTRLLEDPLVTDLCIGGDGQIWVDRGAGLRLTGSRFVGGAALRGFATALAQRAGRRLDDAVPFADLPLGGGLRVHVVLPPIAPDGPHLSIRIGARQPFTLDQLVAAGSVSALGARLLRSMVRHRQSFLVTGGAGSGKTTVLATLLGLAEPAERVVLVEDTPELRPALPHLVRLQSRPGNQDGAGQLGLSELVREALRMRPDRIVVGECRGVEVLDLLSALNTGHDGSCATVHANRAEDVPARIEALTARAGLPRPAVHSLLAAGVQAVVHLGRAEDGRRRIVTLGACLRADDGTVRIASAYDLLRGTLENGRAAETLGLEPD